MFIKAEGKKGRVWEREGDERGKEGTWPKYEIMKQ